MDLEMILRLNSDEMYEKLVEVFDNQRLTGIARIFSRLSQVLFSGFVLLIIALFPENEDDMISVIFWLFVFGYTIYEFLGYPERKTLENLKIISKKIELFNKYKKGEISLNLTENESEEIEKNIKRYIPILLKEQIFFKIIGLIPIINLLADDLTKYASSISPVTMLLKGNKGFFTRKGGLNLIADNIEEIENKKI